MKTNRYLISIAMFCSALAACGQGFVTTNPPPAQTYDFSSDFNQSATSSDSSCNIYVSPFICNKDSSTITLSLSFSSSNPNTYWLIPTTLPQGVTMTQSPGCSNTSGSNYSCIITLQAQNVAESSVINLPFTGSLGQIGNYIVTYQ